jgi:hypothetical protein
MFGNHHPLLYNNDAASAYMASAPNTIDLGREPPRTSARPSVSTLFFLGFRDFEEFNGVDLLEFVREHNATLNFPQKVISLSVRVGILQPHILTICLLAACFPSSSSC